MQPTYSTPLFNKRRARAERVGRMSAEKQLRQLKVATRYAMECHTATGLPFPGGLKPGSYWGHVAGLVGHRA